MVQAVRVRGLLLLLPGLSCVSPNICYNPCRPATLELTQSGETLVLSSEQAAEIAQKAGTERLATALVAAKSAKAKEAAPATKTRWSLVGAVQEHGKFRFYRLTYRVQDSWCSGFSVRVKDQIGRTRLIKLPLGQMKYLTSIMQHGSIESEVGKKVERNMGQIFAGKDVAFDFSRNPVYLRERVRHRSNQPVVISGGTVDVVVE